MKTYATLLATILLANVGWADFTGKVVGVTDGDTIRVLSDNHPIKIRLNGIDAPETGQAYGQRAKQFVSEQCFGQTVRVEESGTDKYGRTIGDIYLEDETHLNVAVVRNGFAWWYRKYAEGNDVLAQAEEEARKAGRGLWAEPNPVAPWDWRHRNDPVKPNPSSAPASTGAALGLLSQPQAAVGSAQLDAATDTHWMTNSSRKRHNSGCRYFKTTNGVPCGASDGTPCKVCGG
jgi:micrococcal nuclease